MNANDTRSDEALEEKDRVDVEQRAEEEIDRRGPVLPVQALGARQVGGFRAGAGIVRERLHQQQRDHGEIGDLLAMTCQESIRPAAACRRRTLLRERCAAQIVHSAQSIIGRRGRKQLRPVHSFLHRPMTDDPPARDSCLSC